ncbi:toll/interleukin-1 receptor domain-containing protein [Aeromicrobium sp. CF4.19]|uniref:toll/interleukin-1 receptor domain-containing protein n=1 Tax=Aeromicrobium sp. CF4.19 TaxID=3373082 RepID=UPI003EE56FE8
MASDSELRRWRDEVIRARKEVAKASSTVADRRKKANSASAAARRSKSPATIRSKSSEAERHETAALAAEKKRADLEGKVARLEEKITRGQAAQDKKRLADQQRANREIERRVAGAGQQFRPPGGDSPWLPSAAGKPAAAGVDASDDVFLSHASEDKEVIARPLKTELEGRGLTVWFDEIKIKVGQSIRQEIEKGIAHARFGIVIVSPDFLRKQWTQAELDALFDRKMGTGDNLLLPIWHRVTKDEVSQRSPLLAGIHALNTSTMTLDEIADALLEAVRPSE